MHWFNRAILIAAAVLVGKAVLQELQRPAPERTWTGRTFGVPYDPRPPTLSRLRAGWWGSESQAWLTPHTFGVGWSVNLHQLTRR